MHLTGPALHPTFRFVMKTDLQIAVAEIKAGSKAELQREIAALRSDLARFKSDLVKWMVCLILVAALLNAITDVGAMVALIKVLGH
jgi:hypothetical protein